MRETNRSRLHFRIAFAITAMIILGIAAILPFTVRNVVDDVLGSAVGGVIRITPAIPGDATSYCRLHLALVGIDEAQLLATLRLAGHCSCRVACDGTDRIVLASMAADDALAEGMPPSATITLQPAGEAVTETIQLPVRGHPVRYPFDHYEMVLGIAFQHIATAGKVETLPLARVTGHLALSIQELLPRQTMAAPVSLDPESFREGDDAIPYDYAFGLVFERPIYLRLLAVILVLLIAAAAAYAVFMRPLQDLVVNSGALVLGVWGIRGILTPGNIYYLTAVDLALSVVIIFLLGAITVRAFLFIHDKAELELLGRRRGR